MPQQSLLATKLYIPPVRPELVARPRLIKRLNAALPTQDAFPRALTLISAPAGFGKTTLVAEWVHKVGAHGDAPPHVAWLSLDEGYNDPARFLAYLIAALRTVEANIGKGTLSALQFPQPTPGEAVLTSLINEIAALPGRIVLVLDDHHTMESSQVDDALAFLLKGLPQQMHLVIATREDPRLPLARLRAQGQLTEVRASDLRFTCSEAAEFLNQAMGLELSARDIAALDRRTEGWITGLHLAAVSMQGHKDLTGFVESFTGSHRFVLDYLIEEVLQHQPESIQTFLLQTSVLNRLNGSLCDAMRIGCAEPHTDQDKGQQILEYLEHANLFVVPLDDERRWYRYHHLFADLLRQRLHKTQSALVPELHRKASKWYEKNSLKDEAVDHALAAGDSVRAGYLIEELAEVLWERGEHVRLLGWLDRLSEEQLSTMPQIGIFHSWILHTTGQEKAAEKRLQTVERVLASVASGVSPGDPDRTIHPNTGQLKSRVSVVHARLAFREGDTPNIIRFSRQALESLPENDLTWRSLAAMALGDSHVISGDMKPAEKACQRRLELAKKEAMSIQFYIPAASWVLYLSI